MIHVSVGEITPDATYLVFLPNSRRRCTSTELWSAPLGLEKRTPNFTSQENHLFTEPYNLDLFNWGQIRSKFSPEGDSPFRKIKHITLSKTRRSIPPQTQLPAMSRLRLDVPADGSAPARDGWTEQRSLPKGITNHSWYPHEWSILVHVSLKLSSDVIGGCVETF